MSRTLVTRSRLFVAATALVLTGAAGVAGGAAFAADGPAENVGETSRTAAVTVAALPVDAARFAVIDANANVVRGSAGVTAGLTGAGNVEVLFDRDIRNCAYTATIGGRTTDVPGPGFLSVSQRANKPNGVFVSRYDRNGVKTSVPFHLAVTC